MRGLPKRIMEYAEAHPEATPLCPGALLHLGHRAAIDQALSRLARSGELMRVCQGVYMRPVETRFGASGAASRQGPSPRCPYSGAKPSCPAVARPPTASV